MNYRKRIAKLEQQLREQRERAYWSDYNSRVSEQTKKINNQLANTCNVQLAELRALREECAKLRMSEGEQHQ